jgi:hypothetical protein
MMDEPRIVNITKRDLMQILESQIQSMVVEPADIAKGRELTAKTSQLAIDIGISPEGYFLILAIAMQSLIEVFFTPPSQCHTDSN